NQFAPSAAVGVHLRAVLQQVGEFLPLFVVAGLDDAQGLLLQIFQDQDLRLQFGNGLGGAGLVDHLIGVELVFLGAQFLVELVDVVGQFDLLFDGVFAQCLRNAFPHFFAAGDQFFLFQP